MSKILCFACFSILFISCQNRSGQPSTFSIQEITLDSDQLTPEILWRFGRIGDVAISPDKQTILFTVTYTDIKNNKNYSDLYTVLTRGGAVKRITDTETNEFGVSWRPDGKKIACLSSQSGQVQLWEMNPDGTDPYQVTDIHNGITAYWYSPTQTHLAYTTDVKVDSTVADQYPDLPLVNARIENDLMYRHWDQWEDGTYSHLFISQYCDGQLIEKSIDLMPGERYDTPLKPYDNPNEIAWSPDGKSIVYSCKKLTGKEYAFSTNSDLYRYHLETETTTNLTIANPGYDRNPVFSHNGQFLAWESMQRDGYEADKNRLMLLDFSTDRITDLTLNFDQNAGQIAWNHHNELFFISNTQGTEEIYRYSMLNQTIERISNGIHDYTSIWPLGDTLIATKMSMNQPTEVYTLDLQSGLEQNISNINTSLLDQLKMGKVESRWMTTTDGKKMQCWVIYPPDFDPLKKYPALLFCQGGPQNTVSQFWSLRWNFQLMAVNGYIVIAPNRRGVPGFGQEWCEQISGDYGGQNMQDYLTAVDEMSKEPFVDKDRLGAVGPSYGGYSIYWLAGNHQKRFKAFISHCGIFNFEQMYSTTEEMFFVNWDYKGPYWDLSNPDVQKSYAFSPHRFVQNWDTPILVVHGEKDFRIPFTQGMGAFNSAIMKGVPARFIYFSEENHWVLKPQNSIFWHREFYKWLDKWLKQ